MSSKSNPYPILENGRDELNENLRAVSNAILVKAINLALKNGHPYIDKTYIKKASQQTIKPSSAMVWALRLFLLVLAIIIPIQISGLLAVEVLASPVGVQISLWLLPIFSVFSIIALSWVFRDFIL